jgi:hypothetical protein
MNTVCAHCDAYCSGKKGYKDERRVWIPLCYQCFKNKELEGKV